MIDDDVPQEGAKVSLTRSNTKQMQWGIICKGGLKEGETKME